MMHLSQLIDMLSSCDDDPGVEVAICFSDETIGKITDAILDLAPQGYYSLEEAVHKVMSEDIMSDNINVTHLKHGTEIVVTV